MDEDDHRMFAELLGEAVMRRWGVLPQEAQEELFEAAVAARSVDVGESLLREQGGTKNVAKEVVRLTAERERRLSECPVEGTDNPNKLSIRLSH